MGYKPPRIEKPPIPKPAFSEIMDLFKAYPQTKGEINNGTLEISMECPTAPEARLFAQKLCERLKADSRYGGVSLKQLPPGESILTAQPLEEEVYQQIKIVITSKRT